MLPSPQMTTMPEMADDAADITLGEFVLALMERWRWLLGAPLASGALAVGLSYLIPPTFTARTSFLPPAQQQGAAAGALASLGALAGFSAGVRNTGDQYVTFLQSRSIADRMLERFDLQKVYEEKLAQDARLDLADRTRVSLGKKDGIIVLEVDDHDPKRASDMASAYIEELRKLTAGLALTEAQQRRMFFEAQLKQVRDRLSAAQAALQASGLSASSIKAEPKAAVDAVAKLRAELMSAEVRLQVLKRGLADGTPEVQQQSTLVAGLRAELARQAAADTADPRSGYISTYREFKYQEALFDLIARQYEMARVDESRDGGQLQVIDEAQVPERKSKPKRSLFAIAGVGLAALVIVLQTVVLLNRRRARPPV